MEPNQLTVFFCLLCVRICLFKWSLRMNFLLHSGHWKRFSPVCVRRCRCSSSDRVKRLPQNTHEHANGLSPVLQRNNKLNLDFVYTFKTVARNIEIWHCNLNGMKVTYQYAISNELEDVMFCHKLYCNQEYDKCVDVYDLHVVHLQCNWDMCKQLVSNVVSQLKAENK